jgi:hypothetical protein
VAWWVRSGDGEQRWIGIPVVRSSPPTSRLSHMIIVTFSQGSLSFTYEGSESLDVALGALPICLPGARYRRPGNGGSELLILLGAV